MAKRKSDSEAQVDSNEVQAEETVSPETVQANELEAPTKGGAPTRLTIETEEEAREYVKTNYQVPNDVKVVLVTSDMNVFWVQNEGSAVNHAQRNNLKLFRLLWD